MIGPVPYHGESNWMIVKTDYWRENIYISERLKYKKSEESLLG